MFSISPPTYFRLVKRDLRTQDHAPPFYTEQAGLPYIILFLFEPVLCAHPYWVLRHAF